MAEINTPIPKLKMNDGHEIPMLGYGTGTAWYKRGDESQIDRAVVDATKKAIQMGYHHLDGAEVYKTEQELGLAIKESGVDRSKLFITTKVGTETGLSDIPSALRTSLKKLQLDHVDLYLIHHPFFGTSDADLQRAWSAMEEVQASGLARSIGVSNYLPKHIEATMETARVKPAVNQIEFHPYLQHEASGLLETHRKYGIVTAAYGPLTAVTKASPGPLDEYYEALAKKYAVSAAEVALRWCVDRDVVAITTSGKEQRMSDYLRAMMFKLTKPEVEKINELGREKHFRGFWGAKFDENDKS
jgi:diketogulonate reductase-like aldo/keto reductase